MSKGTVMVVDDKGIVAKDIARKVKALGYSVPATAGSYEDAIAKAESLRPDMLLMDIKLKSQKDGIETAEDIFKRFQIPVIYITAYSDEDTLERAKRTKPYGFIVKPFEEKALEITLKLAFERLAVEKALEEKEVLYRLLVENAEEIVWAVDKDINMIYMSPAVEKLWGYTSEEMFKIPIENLVAPDQLDIIRNITKGFQDPGKAQFPRQNEVDLKLVRKDGTLFWGNITFKSVFNKKNELIQIQGSIRDVTQRKETEARIRSQFDQFTTMLDKFPEYLYISDPRTHEVLFVNQKFRDLTGREIVGGKCYQEFQGLDHPCEFCTNDIILKTRMPHVWDLHNPHLGRHMLITDQIITWPDGRDVRFEVALDITDQKKLESIVKSTEMKYRSFMEQASYGFFVMDLYGNITEMNWKGTQISGYSLDKKTPYINFDNIIIEEDLPRAKESLALIMSQKSATNVARYRIKRADGKIISIEVNTVPLIEKGKITGFHGTLLDISDKIKAENELKEKTEFLDAVINNTTDGIFVIDEDFNYVLINPASGRILGHNPDDWIGKRAGSNRHPEDENISIEAVMKALSGEPSSCDVRVKASDGTYHLLHMRYSLMMMGDDFNILGMVTDITEKKKAEVALKESEEKYRNLFEHSPESITLLDANGIIQECNDATLKITGLAREELLGKPFVGIGLLEEGDREYFTEILGSLVKGSTVKAFEMELVISEDQSRWIEVYPRSIHKGQEFVGIQMISRDITERKLAEKGMKHKLMRFEMEDGHLYLAKEARPTQSLDAFKELLMVGYQGTLYTRSSKKEFEKTLEFGYAHVKISDRAGTNAIRPARKDIIGSISEVPRGNAVLIDCVEYCMTRMGEKKALNMIQDLRDLAQTRNLIIILSIDPSALSEKTLRLIELESQDILPSVSLTKIPEKLLDTLRYIGSLNKDGIKPSYSDIGDHFELSKPTVRTRIRQLQEIDAVAEISKGRMKVLELTGKGKNYLAL